MSHHRTLFPLLVVALTLALGTMIFFSFRERFESTLNNGNGHIDAVEYEANAHAALKDLRVHLAAAPSDTDRAAILQQTQQALLLLIVPSDYKDVHLEMVMTLAQWIAGEAGDAEKLSTAQTHWEALIAQYPWIE